MVGKVTLDNEEDYLIYRVGSGQTVEIFDIHVSNERRRQGLGRRLIELLIANRLPPGTKKIWAITRAANGIAQEFYHKAGFRVIAPLRDFYGIKDQDGKDTIDAIMFGRDVL